ncbi:VOC family protein (plasmid) [Streptomyces sp. BI20]|uniref:VOC family protein n=1 Tax=Streptomyces sp. BI20 TaxID=3403460 RepID=UPI003C712A5E
MAITVTPHLNFRGNAREAIEFYHSVFGGSLLTSTHEETGTELANPGEAPWLAFGEVTTEDGFHLAVYDVPTPLPYDPGTQPYYLMVSSGDPKEITRYWEKLRVGASVQDDLGPKPWSSLYGLLVDRFGVMWALNLDMPQD